MPPTVSTEYVDLARIDTATWQARRPPVARFASHRGDDDRSRHHGAERPVRSLRPYRVWQAWQAERNCPQSGILTSSPESGAGRGLSESLGRLPVGHAGPRVPTGMTKAAESDARRRPQRHGHGSFGTRAASHASTSSMVHRPLGRGLRTQSSAPKCMSQML
jgi:hypothetical protein